MLMNANEYLETVELVKQEIRTAQYRATVQVNGELLRLYHAIGTVINAHKVWGSKFVENLAADIKLSFPEMKGYSVRNLKYMAKFAEAYSADELCNNLLHKFRGAITLFCWIRSRTKSNGCGMQNRVEKTAGRATFWCIRSRVTYISGRRWPKRYLILNCGCRPHRVNLPSRQ